MRTELSGTPIRDIHDSGKLRKSKPGETPKAVGDRGGKRFEAMAMKTQSLRCHLPLPLLAGLAVLCGSCASPPRPLPPGLAVDHISIMVQPGAPERAALEELGLRIAPTINRHDGQGTASATVELDNAFLELIWVDPSVPVAPTAEAAVRKFRLRSEWRTSGWCPFGFALHRTPGAPATLPIPSWSVHAEWMPPGKDLEILTPRDDTTSPSIYIPGWSDPVPAEVRQHPLGVHQLTGVRLRTPKGFVETPVFRFFADLGIVQTTRGEDWTLELTLDRRRQGKTADLRPRLPLLIQY